MSQDLKDEATTYLPTLDRADRAGAAIARSRRNILKARIAGRLLGLNGSAYFKL